MENKPHFQIIYPHPLACGLGGSPLGYGDFAPKAESKIDLARRRFGQPFAHEPGATWRPRETPFLTAWMQTRGK